MATLGWPTSRRPDDRPGRVAPGGWVAPLKVSDHPLARGARGELAWDQGSQSGELRLKGLAEVDPKKGGYQLWIFDSGRDPRYPIDGGVFTVADPAAATTVPVRAKLARRAAPPFCDHPGTPRRRRGLRSPADHALGRLSVRPPVRPGAALGRRA